jgi:ribosome-binding factor A
MKKGQMRRPGTRPLRVGEEIRHALADILGRGELRDEELAGRTITITEVNVSPDLRNASVYVMPLGGRDIDVTLAALRRATPFLRGEVARRVRLRFAPDLRFFRDERFDSAERVEEILRSPEVAHDLQAAEGGQAETSHSSQPNRTGPNRTRP